MFPHRLSQELSPLNNPFKWTIDLLSHAEQISRNKSGNRITYTANFSEFPSIDFRGTLLDIQNNTYLEMTFVDGEPLSLEWVVNPIHPESLGPLVSYPETVTYHLSFDSKVVGVPVLPKEAEEAEELD